MEFITLVKRWVWFHGGEVTRRLSVGMIPPVRSLLDDYQV